MEELDRDLQQRVWQRVAGGTEPVRENGAELARLALESAGAYARLSGRYPRLTGLHRDARDCGACLLAMTDRAAAPGPRVEQLPPAQLLAACRQREQRLWTGLQARAGDPELGPIYRLLAHRTAKRWMTVLELLGHGAQG